ncbi:MAG: hypothetical protein J0H15_07940 [Xanthomonadales bacterium]|nr:hypothetical protein [Xanthomonadales bacterium]
MTTEKDAFAARLNRLLAAKKLPASPGELAGLLARHGASVTPQTISGWLNGTFMPRARNQRALATLLGVSRLALLEDGSPSSAREMKEPAQAWPAAMDGKDAIAFREFATLPAAQRRLVRELIAALAAVPLDRKSD